MNKWQVSATLTIETYAGADPHLTIERDGGGLVRVELSEAGALASALFAKEFRAQGGSSPATRFLLGMFVMIGALVFLGCPLRMILRLAGAI